MNMRMYLPYKATRDTQTVAWHGTGFFLSEHTSEIAKGEADGALHKSPHERGKNGPLLTQLYVHQQLACFRMKKKEGHEMVVGVPMELSDEAVHDRVTGQKQGGCL